MVNNKYICNYRANKVKGGKITQVFLPHCVAYKTFFDFLHK
jgi:hypothetical protein